MATNKYGDTVEIMEVQILNFNSEFPTLRVTSKNVRTDLTEYYDSNAITTVDLTTISGVIVAPLSGSFDTMSLSGFFTDLRAIVDEHVTKVYN